MNKAIVFGTLDLEAMKAETETNNGGEEPQTKLKDGKVSWAKLARVDSLSLEAGRVPLPHSHVKASWRRTLSLAFQSLGIIYGDIGTSPLYVYSGIFPDGLDQSRTDDLFGALSLIIYTIALAPVIKYIFIVLQANDNGDGGTFALYSKICRHAKVGLIPNQQPEDRELSHYKLDKPSSQLKRAQKIKQKLENSRFVQILLFGVTIMATSMVIGDGVLTPCISVLSAVGGIKSLNEGADVGISIAILIILFCVQRFGTDKVGFTFAPVILLWFTFISGIGIYNLVKYDHTVLRAFNPKYIVDYLKRNGKTGWISLGGVFLCITGTEAMFADLGHFNVRAVQISCSCVTFPALLIAYSGQAAYLRRFPENVGNTFYKSTPGPIYWPTFVVALAAAIIASQAMISGTFSIIQQSLSLSSFPNVSIKHTSHKYEGQVYIPEINYCLMIACVIVTAGFKTTTNIQNAYGIAVCMVMLVTTCMVTIIMLFIWNTNILLIILFVAIFGSIELVYLSSLLYKFKQGGYLPIVIAFFLMSIMGIWHYAHRKRYIFELKNKVSSEYMRELMSHPSINRVPGIALLYSELVEGVPPIFSHFVANVPSIYSVVVFVSLKTFPVSRIALEERFLFRHVHPKEYRIFRCVVRCGYNDDIGEHKEFERQLTRHLKEFIQYQNLSLEQADYQLPVSAQSNASDHQEGEVRSTGSNKINPQEVLQQNTNPATNESRASSGSIQSFGSTRPSVQGGEEEMKFVEKALEKHVVYLLGEAEVIAEPNSSIFKRIIIIIYNFLRRNFRSGVNLMAIPHSKLLRVGMTYEI